MMGKKEEFKDFVRLHPELIKYVENDTMTWQKFYEIFDLYGSDNVVWNNYLNVNNNINNSTSWSDIINMAKNIDVDKVQEGITSLQKTLSLFGEILPGNNSNSSTYNPRPLYRRFDD